MKNNIISRMLELMRTNNSLFGLEDSEEISVEINFCRLSYCFASRQLSIFDAQGQPVEEDEEMRKIDEALLSLLRDSENNKRDEIKARALKSRSWRDFK